MNRKNRGGYMILAILFVMMVILVWMRFAPGKAEEYNAWVMCKGYVNLREEPNKKSRTCGFLDAGDGFVTDGKTKNGFLHVLDAGECSCWVYAGYVVRSQPTMVNEYYVVVAKQQVLCRKCVGGRRIKGRLGWMKNGSRVRVYWISEDWALTARGYIRTEWLEVDP